MFFSYGFPRKICWLYVPLSNDFQQFQHILLLRSRYVTMFGRTTLWIISIFWHPSFCLVKVSFRQTRRDIAYTNLSLKHIIPILTNPILPIPILTVMPHAQACPITHSWACGRRDRRGPRPAHTSAGASGNDDRSGRRPETPRRSASYRQHRRLGRRWPKIEIPEKE